MVIRDSIRSWGQRSSVVRIYIHLRCNATATYDPSFRRDKFVFGWSTSNWTRVEIIFKVILFGVTMLFLYIIPGRCWCEMWKFITCVFTFISEETWVNSDLIRDHCVNVECITEGFTTISSVCALLGGGGDVYMYIWETTLSCSSVVSRKV